MAPFSLGHDARQFGEAQRALALFEQARSLVRGQRQQTLWVLEELIFLLPIGSAAQGKAHRAATDEYWRLTRQGEEKEQREGKGVEESRALLRQRPYQVIVEMAGFTHAASLELRTERCAPVQCHWIVYHASVDALGGRRQRHDRRLTRAR